VIRRHLAFLAFQEVSARLLRELSALAALGRFFGLALPFFREL